MVTKNPKIARRARMQTRMLVAMSSLACVLFVFSIKSVCAQKDHRGRGVVLEMGFHLSGGVTTTAFSLTNEDREPFRTTPVCTNYNRLVIVGPDGKRVERFSWKDGIPPVVVEPGGMRSWSLNLAEMPEFKESGTYRVTWKVGELESDEIIVIRPAAKGEGE